jgi:hypothetical protein
MRLEGTASERSRRITEKAPLEGNQAFIQRNPLIYPIARKTLSKRHPVHIEQYQSPIKPRAYPPAITKYDRYGPATAERKAER